MAPRSDAATGRVSGGRRGSPRRSAVLAVRPGRGSPRRAAVLAVTLLFGAGGAGLLAAAVTIGPDGPPQPAAAAAPAQEAPVAAPPPAPAPRPQHFGAAPPIGKGVKATPAPGPPKPKPSPGVSRSTPVQIDIPQIKVQAQLMEVGLEKDGTVQVPPLDKPKLAGWYKYGASPGEVGNAVIVGHVDSKSGP